MKNFLTVIRTPAVRTFAYMWTATVISGIHLIVDVERAKRNQTEVPLD